MACAGTFLNDGFHDETLFSLQTAVDDPPEARRR